LERLQGNFAAVIVAEQTQEIITKEAAEKGEDLSKHMTMEQWLKEQESDLAKALSKHVKDHGCAN
jgi:hypothetical protein